MYYIIVHHYNVFGNRKRQKQLKHQEKMYYIMGYIGGLPVHTVDRQRDQTSQSDTHHVGETESGQPLREHLVQLGHFPDGPRQAQHHKSGPSISLCLRWNLHTHLTGCLRDQTPSEHEA